MVSAWDSRNRLVLGQVKVSDKRNEITAIPELLAMLGITGCIVSIDAMCCQTKIAAQIVGQEANYVLGLKGNQESLHAVVQEAFDEVDERDHEGVRFDYYETNEHGHGREEHRWYWTLDAHEWMEDIAMWAGLRTIVQAESERRIDGKRAGSGVTTSAVWGWKRNRSPRRSAITGALRIACIGFLISRFAKTTAACAADIRAKRNKCRRDDAYMLRVLTN
jgi:predicted transposase YbfD/YdcC